MTINQQETQETAPPCTILRTSHCRMIWANRSTLFPIQAWQIRKGWKPISHPLEAEHVWNLTLRSTGSSGWWFRHHWIMAAESRNCQAPNRFSIWAIIDSNWKNSNTWYSRGDQIYPLNPLVLQSKFGLSTLIFLVHHFQTHPNIVSKPFYNPLSIAFPFIYMAKL